MDLSGPPVPYSQHLKRIVKTSNGRPDGVVNFFFYRPDHAAPKQIDRIDDIAKYLSRHAHCWPDWLQFARHPEETMPDYVLRLSATFDFSKVAARQSKDTVYINTTGSSVRTAGAPSPRKKRKLKTPTSQYKSCSKPENLQLKDNDDFYRESLQPITPPIFDPEELASEKIEWPSFTCAALGMSTAQRAVDTIKTQNPNNKHEFQEQQEGIHGSWESFSIDRDTSASEHQLSSARDLRSNEDSGSTILNSQSSDPVSRDPRSRIGEASLIGLHDEVMGPINENLLGGHSGLGLDPSEGEEEHIEERRLQLRLVKENERNHADSLKVVCWQPSARNTGSSHTADVRGELERFIGRSEAEESAPCQQNPCHNTQAVQEWDGTGFFMRKRELDFVEKIMRAKRKKLLVISGPSQSGKRSIIKQICSGANQGRGEGSRMFAILLDVKACLCAEMRRAICNWVVSQREILPASVFSVAESILANGLDGHLSTRFLESITRCLAQMKATIGLFVSGVSSQMIASDAAVFATEIPKFIASGVGITIVTSDCLLPAALRAANLGEEIVKNEVLGNLANHDAFAYMAGTMGAREIDCDLKRHWPEIHKHCGGNPGLMNKCADFIADYAEDVDTALYYMANEGHASQQRILDGQSPNLRTAYEKAIKMILASPSKAMPASALYAGFATQEVLIRQLIANSNLLLREPAPFLARDLPRQVYGSRHEAVVAIPSSLQVLVWEESLGLEGTNPAEQRSSV